MTKERGLYEKIGRQMLTSIDRANEVKKDFIILLLANFFLNFNRVFVVGYVTFYQPRNLFILLLVSTS